MSLRNETFKRKIHTVIFESETVAGKSFDLALIAFIVLSILVVVFESIPSFQAVYGDFFYIAEWAFTIIFLIEYFLRLYCVGKPLRYVFSFFGLIDLLSCLPTLLSLFFPGFQSLLVIRALRLLRIFRIFKLGWYFDEGVVIVNALKASRAKIFVFLYTVVIIIVIMGAVMYFVEGEESGFVSIPVSMYWAVVTLTTVGYGDITPATPLGRILASILMIVGYGIIAVPTGIVTSELIKRPRKKIYNEACPGCGFQDHESDSFYCRKCGTSLELASAIQQPAARE
jgi:voltage-gated potassium channel